MDRILSSFPNTALGKPIPEDILSNPPWAPDVDRHLEKPFLLKDWLDKNRVEITSNGSKRLFGQTYQSDIVMLGLGNGPRTITSSGGETFIWFAITITIIILYFQ